MPGPQPKLPAAPLLRALDREYPPQMEGWSLFSGRSRADREAIRYGRQMGWFTVWKADDLCVRLLGVHPVAIYPGWFDMDDLKAVA